MAPWSAPRPRPETSHSQRSCLPFCPRPAETSNQDALLEFADWENELAEIERIEPGRLWFRSELGEIGPVLVPERAAEVAKLGWAISALSFGRTDAGWHILDMGNVYPG